MRQRYLRSLGAAAGAPARATVVCFPHAGGAASFFHPWRPVLPPAVRLLGVQYPGRMERLREPPPPDLPALADAVVDELTGAVAGPAALVGHSFGAVVAYEVARRLDPPPAALFASSQRAPQLLQPGTRHLDSEDALWASLCALGAVPEPLADDPEYRDLALPPFRSDLRLLETYRHEPAPVLSIPIYVYRGDVDRQVGAPGAAAWGELTTSGQRVHVLSGGHFAILDHSHMIIEHILEILAP